MSELPDVHPVTGEPTRIVAGVIQPMTRESLRIGGRSSARGEGRGSVDLAYARDLASRRVGPVAEAAIGRALLSLAAQGGDVAALAKGMNEIMALAEGVLSGSPSVTAVVAANRLVTPEGVVANAGKEGAVDLFVLAYAVLHLDEVRALNGGLS